MVDFSTNFIKNIPVGVGNFFSNIGGSLGNLLSDPINTLEQGGLALQDKMRKMHLAARSGNFSDAGAAQGELAGSEIAGAATGIGIGKAVGGAVNFARAVVLAKDVITVDPSRLIHIFRDEVGHVNPTTPAAQAEYLSLFSKIASNPNNFNPAIVPSTQAAKAGVQGFSQIMKTGEQAWVTVKDGKILNAGVNAVGAVR